MSWCGNCVFPQNFHTKKLGEIALFYGVYCEDHLLKQTLAVQNTLHKQRVFKAVFITQKMKFSIKDFFSKCDQIRRSRLLKNFLMENFIFL